MNLNIDSMTLDEIKNIVKVIVQNTLHDHDRITILQDRILEMEREIFKLEKVKE